MLQKCIDFEKPCLSVREKRELMDMLCKYKYVFILGEIGPCLNINVEIDFTDKSQIHIRPCYAKEEKRILDNGIKWLQNLGIVKEGF